MGRPTNLEKICEDFGITRQYVRKLVKNETIPAPNSRGAYDYRGCVKAYIDYLRKLNGGGKVSDKEKRDLELQEKREKIRGQQLSNDKNQKVQDDEAKRREMSLKETAENLDKIMVG